MAEFKEYSDKFEYRGLKFRYDDLHSVLLTWSTYGGRYISLKHDLSKTEKLYKKDYSDVPIPILRASIQFLHEKVREEVARGDR